MSKGKIFGSFVMFFNWPLSWLSDQTALLYYEMLSFEFHIAPKMVEYRQEAQMQPMHEAELKVG